MQAETGRLRVVAGVVAGRPRVDPSTGDAHDDAVPSADAPMPGRFLREQRKRRGMSIEQLALATKIPRASLELLEDDRYDGLPGPVFVKGFLRCAARAVGVDPQVVLDLLYERERAALAARRGSRPVSGPAASAAASPKMPSRPGRRGVTDEPAAALPTRAPRLRAPASPDAPGLVARLRGRMPSPAVFLWLVVAAFVAMVVLAAFNLVGGGHPGQS